jgi:hypothetical protein
MFFELECTGQSSTTRFHGLSRRKHFQSGDDGVSLWRVEQDWFVDLRHLQRADALQPNRVAVGARRFRRGTEDERRDGQVDVGGADLALDLVTDRRVEAVGRRRLARRGLRAHEDAGDGQQEKRDVEADHRVSPCRTAAMAPRGKLPKYQRALRYNIRQR